MSGLGNRSIESDARRLRVLLTASGHIYKTKVSSDDTTPGFLSDKITSADTSVAIAVLNDGADEDLDLSVAVYVAAEIADHAGDPDAHHDQVHVLATTSALGPDHIVSGLTAGMVLQATGAATAVFGLLNHDDLTNVTANQHHNQSHVLATTAGLGADHTTSGLTAGQVLRATSATTAAFASLQATDLPSHVIATNVGLGSQHTISGATSGHVLRASGATAAAFAQLQHSDLGGVGANDHHNQQHTLVGSDHTATGLTSGHVLRATGATTFAFAAIQATDLPSHVLATNVALGSQHTISGATAGHVLRASGATAAAFAQLQHSDLGSVGANDHHNQSHVLASTSGLGADHTVSGLTARQVLIASSSTAALFRALVAADLPTGATLSVSSSNSGDSHAITSSNDATAASILASDTDGRLGLEGLGILTAPDGDYVKLASGVAVGLGAAAGRFIFTDDTTDQVALLDATYLVGSNTPDANTEAIAQIIDGNFSVSANGASGGINSFVYSSTADHIPTFRGRKSLGTRSSPSAVGSGTVLARFGGAGWSGTAFPTESNAYIEMRSTQTHSGSAAGSHIRFGVTPDDSTTAAEVARLEGAGRLLIAETSNAYQAIGVTVNMGTNSNEIATFKQNNVAHGMTSVTDTNVFGAISIRSGTAGGMVMSGYHEGTVGLELNGVGVTDLTGKTSASEAYLHLNTKKKSGAGTTAPGANANLVAIRKDGTTVWIVDTEGDTHRDGTDNTFDTYHDAHLARAFDRVVSPGAVVDGEFDSWVQYGRDDLIAAGILHESGFYNESRLLRLAIGAVWQEYTERQRLALRVRELEQRLLN